jgi:LmbE family N-acetylglucosaminyl deacetylase
VAALMVVYCPACCGQPDDPANLSGERVRVRAGAPAAPDARAAALRQLLIKLRTRASLMMIVAHPDDEDGGMMSRESIGKGARVAALTLTRGEGGQNLVSSDLNDALGLIRTEELLAADRLMDVDQMFGTEVDFGFSKTMEEAFSQWTHERVLYDAVRAIRLYRPLVLTSEFIGGPTDGHGQHQVAGEITQEVFAAAADPALFPEMGLEPWAPLKVYARVPFAYVTLRGIYDYATNQFVPLRFFDQIANVWSGQIPKANVVVPEGESNELLGMSYVQFARKGLEIQKTQNDNNLLMRLMAHSGPFDVSYHRYGSRVKTIDHEQTFFDGIDVSLEGISTLAPSDQPAIREALKEISEHIMRAAGAFSASAPERCAPELRKGLTSLDRLITSIESGALPGREKVDVLHELRVKRVQFNEALLESLGLSVEASIQHVGRQGECSTVLAPGCTVHILTRVINKGRVPVIVTGLALSAGTDQPKKTGAEESATLNPGSLLERFFDLNQGAGPGKGTAIAETRPYFTRKGIDQPWYDLIAPNLRLAPRTPSPSVQVRMSYDGVLLSAECTVSAPKREARDPDRPLEVVPSLSISINPSTGIIPLSAVSFPVNVEVHNNESLHLEGQVRLLLPAGWRSVPRDATLAIRPSGETQHYSFQVMPRKVEQRKYTLTAVAQVTTGMTREGYRVVGYPGLLPTNLYSPATYTASMVDVKVAPGLKLGYLAGTGDEVPRSLADLGVHVTELSMKDVIGDHLATYDVVMLGVQAYSAHPDLAHANEKLLTYAKAGGVLIVQYNRGRFNYGPYPYALGIEEKVVEETAPVKFLIPDDPVLRWPNRTTANDFAGWVEERGHSFMARWDDRYKALLETHDSGQAAQKGGLLVARTGNGFYIYVAFALHRQLPEGVSGACRLLANLLSVGKAAGLKGSD